MIRSLLIALAIMFIVNILEHFEINHITTQRDEAQNKVHALTSDIEEQNAAVEQMKNESAKQITKLLLAQKEAQKERDSYNKKSQQIMAQNVSEDCKKAVAWGAKTGANLYECWAIDCKA